MNFIRTERGLTVFAGGKKLSVTSDDSRWAKALELITKGDEPALLDLLQPAVRLNNYVSSSGDLKVDGGVLLYKGQPLPGNMHLVQRALQQSAEGFPVQPLLNFIENLMSNPSRRAVHELLQFLEYGELPITPDGHFLAYKRVRENYKDVHSGRIDNRVGQVVEMPRNEVDDRSEVTCSYGLHFCSREYLSNFSGARMMVLKINPRDVVSIPTDYNNTKGRCCRYEVVGELTDEYRPEDGRNAWETSVVDKYERAPESLDLTPSFEIGQQVEVYGEPGEIVDHDRIHSRYLVEEEDGERRWYDADEIHDLADDTNAPMLPVSSPGVTVSESYEPQEGEICRNENGHVIHVLDDYGRSEDGHGRYRVRNAATGEITYLNSDQVRPA